jgi:hypothetical protein
MTLPDFKSLDYREQTDLLHKEAVYVGKRKIFSQTVVLFQLHTFYVEVYYYEYRKIIPRIRCTESIEILDPYLEQIDVEPLVNIFD